MKQNLQHCILAFALLSGVACRDSPDGAAESKGPKYAVALDAETFAAKVAAPTNGVVLVDFWATWCGPCIKVAPTVEKVAEKFKGRALVGKIDVDQQPKLAQQYGIESIPCLILFKNGKPADKLVGLASEADISALIEKHL
jgi:thioredoxin 1